MRRRPERSARKPHDRRAAPAPQARRDHARRRRSAGELDEAPPRRRFSFLYVEAAVIGAITIAGVLMSLRTFAGWIMALLGW